MIEKGTIVHSLDTRDDREVYFVVLETGVPTRAGMTCKIAECGREEEHVYRQDRLLREADAEIRAEVDAAKAEARACAFTLQARALYEVLAAAIPDDLNVEGEVTPGGDVDSASIVLDSAFDRIDEVLEALRRYEEVTTSV
jgi:hypothetical protein